jgi:hypothetical protein
MYDLLLACIQKTISFIQHWPDGVLIICILLFTILYNIKEIELWNSDV